MQRRFMPAGLLLFCLVLSSAGQNTHKRPEHPDNDGPVPDARSFTELFTKLEARLDRAAQERDAATLEALLAPEFLLRTSMDPDTAVSRVSWIDTAIAGSNHRKFTHEAVTIRAFVGVAVVSFVCRQTAIIDGKDQHSDYLIVDVWEANHGKWQVGARYMAPVSKAQS